MAASQDTLPVVKGKRRRVTVVAELEEFGKKWRLVRPNAIKANRVFGDDDSMNMGALNDYFKDHVHPDERDDFITAAINDPTMDIEELMELMRRMSEAVFAGVETGDDDDEAIEAKSTVKP